jgi:hypothetical protein
MAAPVIPAVQAALQACVDDSAAVLVADALEVQTRAALAAAQTAHDAAAKGMFTARNAVSTSLRALNALLSPPAK